MAPLYILIGILVLIILVLVLIVVRKSSQATSTAARLHEVDAELISLRARLGYEQEKLSVRDVEVVHLNSSLTEVRQELEACRRSLVKVESERDEARRKVEEFNRQTDAMKEELKKEFALVAARIIEEKSEKITDHQKNSLKNLLEPLQQNIEAFKKQVSDSYDTEAKERHTLTHIIRELKEQNSTLSKEANALAEALKGQSKVQGDWGEMILERILENSGLSRGREYELQEYITDRLGNRITNEETHRQMRPDAIIHFPRERDLIIDAKVSLKAYLDYHEAETEEERQRAIDRHLVSIRTHIEELCKRDYSAYLDTAPDFVIMFFPYEAAYNLAMHHNPDIWQLAYKKKVLMMGPSNLIGMLKILYDLWSKEIQIKNVEQIVTAANKMYEKFATFADTFVKIGAQLNTAQTTYEQAKRQLTTGPGNLLRQIERVKVMGLPSTKAINPALTPEEETDESSEHP